MITLQIHATPDALVKVYQTTATTETVLYLDTTDANGLTAAISLPEPTPSVKTDYLVDVTTFD